MITYYDYNLASEKNGTLSNNLIKREAQHKRMEVKIFTEKYKMNRLVWYEQTNDIRITIKREKQIKKGKRKWNIRLIGNENLNGMICFLKSEGRKIYLIQIS